MDRITDDGNKQCIICKSSFKMKPKSLIQNQLFVSWKANCVDSLWKALDLDISELKTEEVFDCCERCSKLVYEVDFLFRGVEHLESLLAKAKTKLLKICKQKRPNEVAQRRRCSELKKYYDRRRKTKCDSSSDTTENVQPDNSFNNIDDLEDECGHETDAQGNAASGKQVDEEDKLEEVVEYQCPVTGCCETYANNSALGYHLCVEHTHDRQARNICQFCGLSFRSNDDGREDFEKHELLHRNAEIPYACVVSSCCSTFTNFQDLKKHVLELHEETTFRCDLCPGKYFRTRSTMKSHMTLVHPRIKKTMLRCFQPECSFSTFKKSTLRNHLKVHNNDRPHMCDECGSTYKTLGVLKRHLLIHTGEAPYKCKYCPKSFNMSHKLKNHEETHAPNLTYLCSGCGKAFRSKTNLFQHSSFHCHTRSRKRLLSKGNDATRRIEQNQNLSSGPT